MGESEQVSPQGNELVKQATVENNSNVSDRYKELRKQWLEEASAMFPSHKEDGTPLTMEEKDALFEVRRSQWNEGNRQLIAKLAEESKGEGSLDPNQVLLDRAVFFGQRVMEHEYRRHMLQEDKLPETLLAIAQRDVFGGGSEFAEKFGLGDPKIITDEAVVPTIEESHEEIKSMQPSVSNIDNPTGGNLTSQA